MSDNGPHELPIEDASNVLVLAPLTPTGNRACIELLTSTSPPARSNIAAITYTQPPETWLADWRSQSDELPAELAFIHANNVETTPGDESVFPDQVSVAKVDPSQPMDIVAPLTERLTRWQDGDKQSIVSVQTLTILLEYVDFDTAFRYLHILTNRVQAADAVSFCQIDPDVHDAETINTLKTLFDSVIEVSDDGQEWRVSATYGGDAEVPTADHAQSHDTDETATGPKGGTLDSVRTFLSSLVGPEVHSDGESSPRTGGDSSSADADRDGVTGGSTTRGGQTADAGDGEESTDAGDAKQHEEIPDELMMSDEDRVCQLLTEYGGRMKQTDVTAETEWSKSTVSRKLSDMEEKGLITRVQVGRGNLVFLSGYEPESTKAPFEEEEASQ